MKNIYAMALEGRTEVEREAAEPTMRTVVMAGPLSEQFTQELNRQYSKADPVTGTAQEPDSDKVATESQAQDVTIMSNLITNLSRKAVDPEQATPEAPVTIYGVDEAEITPEDVVDVTSRLVDAKDARDVVVIVQGDESDGGNANVETAPAAEVEEVAPGGAERVVERSSARAALESIVKKFGGSIYPSLEAFCKACEDSEIGGVPEQDAEPYTPEEIGDGSTAQVGGDLSDPLTDSMDAPPTADGSDALNQ